MKNIFNYLKSYLSEGQKEAVTIPGGFCPNCWGRQEYAGKFYDAIKTEHIDTNNIDEKTGWVEAYAEKNLIGIQLREKDGKMACNNCSMQYELSQN